VQLNQKFDKTGDGMLTHGTRKRRKGYYYAEDVKKDKTGLLVGWLGRSEGWGECRVWWRV